MPVVDVFSGRCKGNLRVVLAMGQWEQIISLQRTRAEECDSAPHLTRPVHLLDHLPHSGAKVSFDFGGVNLLPDLDVKLTCFLAAQKTNAPFNAGSQCTNVHKNYLKLYSSWGLSMKYAECSLLYFPPGDSDY